MIRIEMTEHEAKAFLVMLEQAADEFGNHGCNDFDVGQVLRLPEDKAIEVAKELRLGMIQDKVIDPEEAETRGPYLYDWLILAWLKRKIKNALTPASG